MKTIHVEYKIEIFDSISCDGCMMAGYIKDGLKKDFTGMCFAYGEKIGKRQVKCEPCLLACRESLMEG